MEKSSYSSNKKQGKGTQQKAGQQQHCLYTPSTISMITFAMLLSNKIIISWLNYLDIIIGLPFVWAAQTLAWQCLAQPLAQQLAVQCFPTSNSESSGPSSWVNKQQSFLVHQGTPLGLAEWCHYCQLRGRPPLGSPPLPAPWFCHWRKSVDCWVCWFKSWLWYQFHSKMAMVRCFKCNETKIMTASSWTNPSLHFKSSVEVQ